MSCLFTLLLATTFSGPTTDTSSFGRLTVTESLIRQEIIRLGGDWESGARPQLVSFIGPKFQSSHYEMLTHLPGISFFSAADTSLDSYGLSCISQVRDVDRIDIVRCRVRTGSLSVLRANRRLTSIRVESTLVHDGFFDAFSELVNIRSIVFDDVEIPDVLVDELVKMPWLKECKFIRCRGLSEDKMEKLKEALPNTEL